MRKAMSLALLLLVAMFCNAQMADPVKFKSHLKTGSTAEAEIVFDGKIAHGWHVYSTNLGSDGPIEASFHVDKKDGVELVGKLTPRGHEISMMDNMFGMKLRFFENSVQFVQKVKFTKPTYTLKAYLEYGACNDEMCMPPTQVNAHFSGKSPAIDGKAAADEKSADDVAETLKAGGLDSSMVKAGAVDSVAVADSAAAPQLDNAEVQKLWTPVIKELAKFDKPVSNSLLYIFLAGLVGGFLALFTPCVWPIIPMTVSFFLKRNKDRKKAIREAITYGVSIVVIYVALGLIVSLLFGASALNALSTNAIFNILFCLLLVVFAASFFGAFEITLPSSWSNKIDQKSDETSGVLSIFLMAFTLSLVSFSCTGPIIGFLLVAVASEGSIVAPTIGMLGFAVALAIPFALFAMFPTLLKSAPKSGGWMNVLKVVLGFIELAFALKFLSVADLAYGWHILDRETFLALWIAIFSLLGLYLLGIFNFPHDDENRRTNVPQFFLALGSLAFAFYMIPGLWGAPLKAVSAFAPPMNTQDFNLYKNEVHPRFKDFEAGMAAARLEGKPVMIDFTGFGCVNCRKMEAAVWTDAKVADMLNNKYVLISLYVDDKTPLPEQMTVTDTDGTQRTLRTVGDKWSYLQRYKFGSNTQPMYILLDNEGKPLTGSRSYDEDINEYMDFLKVGLDNYNK
ncbi:protein-disulfide reductase DsbD family protein [Prevotella sp.]|uniref:protein-disulfide reductase DsbD family protein n=1 Tax=Prevotella sp. TaxID=59823 RepID=UPI002E75B4B2|nr:cytochrome c biogenesis protein CcdA [Prevotella sp.]MEE0671054.1 cytochrome c biogenesis protein CcdA [Prevotella sp.]